MKKKILLLGGSEQQLIAIKTAKRLGYFTILCDYLTDNPGQFEADKFYLVSTTDKDKVLEIAKKERIDGVIAYASDPAAPTASFVAEQMGLPGNPYKSVEILCNKDKFREYLISNGFNAPSAKGYSDCKEVFDDKYSFKYPIIIKPADSSGSKGVTVLHSDVGLQKSLEYAFSYSRTHRIIIENFIEKKHPYLIGGDVFIRNGKVILWGLLNCHRDSQVNPLVPVGKSYPLQLGKKDIENTKEVISRMVESLDIRNGSINVEFVIDKNNDVWPIDIGPRSGGNMIPDLLGDIFDVDIVEMSIDVAMGIPIIKHFHEPKGFYATYNLHTKRNGVYHSISFSPELEHYIYRQHLYKKPGDLVQYFDNAGKCLGIIFMKFPDQKTMDDIIKRIDKLITINLE